MANKLKCNDESPLMSCDFYWERIDDDIIIHDISGGCRPADNIHRALIDEVEWLREELERIRTQKCERCHIYVPGDGE